MDKDETFERHNAAMTTQHSTGAVDTGVGTDNDDQFCCLSALECWLSLQASHALRVEYERVLNSNSKALTRAHHVAHAYTTSTDSHNYK